MNLELFLADERWVPLDHPDSNWKSVSNALHQTITGIPYATTPSESAQLYEEILSRSFEGDRTARWPQFDFLLLGLGSDGHVASLFPSPPGKIIERSRRGWVVVTESPLHPHPRVTLAWDTILSARETWLIVSGGEKSVALKQLMEGNPKLPASRLMETRGVCTIAIESQKELVHA
jgi:6-phosphogluconolactonase